jgi:hypothetical protein
MFSTNANIMKLVKEKEGTIKTVVYPDLAKFMATYQDLFVILGVWQKEPNPVASASSSESARGSRRSLELPSGGPESKRLKASASIQTPVRIATPLSSTQSVPAKHRLPSDSESSSITTERVSSTTLKSTTPVLAALPSAAGKKTTSNPPSVSGKDRLLGDSTSSQTPTKRIGISMSELATRVLAARPPPVVNAATNSNQPVSAEDRLLGESESVQTLAKPAARTMQTAVKLVLAARPSAAAKEASNNQHGSHIILSPPVPQNTPTQEPSQVHQPETTTPADHNMESDATLLQNRSQDQLNPGLQIVVQPPALHQDAPRPQPATPIAIVPRSVVDKIVRVALNKVSFD